jgi:hypothetical protein
MTSGEPVLRFDMMRARHLQNPVFLTDQSGMMSGLSGDRDSAFDCRPVGSV